MSNYRFYFIYSYFKRDRWRNCYKVLLHISRVVILSSLVYSVLPFHLKLQCLYSQCRKFIICFCSCFNAVNLVRSAMTNLFSGLIFLRIVSLIIFIDMSSRKFSKLLHKHPPSEIQAFFSSFHEKHGFPYQPPYHYAIRTMIIQSSILTSRNLVFYL